MDEFLFYKKISRILGSEPEDVYSTTSPTGRDILVIRSADNMLTEFIVWNKRINKTQKLTEVEQNKNQDGEEN